MFEIINETSAVVKTEKHTFFLDSSENGLEEHALLMADFKDEKKLNKFVSLLDKDHQTAYAEYLNQRV